MFKKFLVLMLILTACVGCSSQDGADEDVGTIITRPQPPANAVFPDFEGFIPETTLGSAEDIDAEVVAGANLVTNLNVLTVWNSNVTEGGFSDARDVRDVLEPFGETLAQAISDAGITEITDETQTVDLPAGTTLADTTAAWEIEMIQEDEDYIRFYFRNQDTGLIEASYLLQNDADLNPVRGIFAYVNPELLSSDAASGRRLFALAFDFTDTSSLRMVVRMEKFSDVTSRYHAQQFHQECFSATECSGEFLQIKDPSPLRNLDDVGFRFTWDEATSEVCLAGMDYSSGAAVVGDTFFFAGPEGPTEGNTELNTCSSTAPVWDGHVFSTEDLIARYADTDPVGGTALEYYIDGSSQEGWNMLTSDLIDGWLVATEF